MFMEYNTMQKQCLGLAYIRSQIPIYDPYVQDFISSDRPLYSIIATVAHDPFQTYYLSFLSFLSLYCQTICYIYSACFPAISEICIKFPTSWQIQEGNVLLG